MAKINTGLNKDVSKVINALKEALAKATNEDEINQVGQAAIDSLQQLGENITYGMNKGTRTFLEGKITGVQQRISNRKEQLAEEAKLQAQSIPRASDSIAEDHVDKVDDDHELSDQEHLEQGLAPTVRAAWLYYYDNIWAVALHFVESYVLRRNKSDQVLNEVEKEHPTDAVQPLQKEVRYENKDILSVNKDLVQGAISGAKVGDRGFVPIAKIAEQPRAFIDQISPENDEPVYLNYFGQESEYVTLNPQQITIVESTLVTADVVTRGEKALTDLAKLDQSVVDDAMMETMQTTIHSFLQSLPLQTNKKISTGRLFTRGIYDLDNIQTLLDELSHTGAIVVSSSKGEVYIRIQDLLKNPNLHLDTLIQFHAGAKNVSFQLSSSIPQLTDGEVSPDGLTNPLPSTTIQGVKRKQHLSLIDLLSLASHLMALIILLKSQDSAKTKLLSSSPENLVSSALTLKNESLAESVNPTEFAPEEQGIEEGMINESIPKEPKEPNELEALEQPEEPEAPKETSAAALERQPQSSTQAFRSSLHATRSDENYLTRQIPEPDPNQALQRAVKTAYEHYAAWLKTNKDPNTMQHARGKLGWFSTQQWRHGQFGESKARELNDYVKDHNTDFSAMVKEINHTLRESNMNRHSFGSFLLDELRRSPVLQSDSIAHHWFEIEPGKKKNDRSWWKNDQKGLYSKEEVKKIADKIDAKIDGQLPSKPRK